MVTWTVDVEKDWGGRSKVCEGIQVGLPRVFKIFKSFGIRAIFFVSTELLRTHGRIINEIRDSGHQIGSHGHFHCVWKDKWRAEEDRIISCGILIDHNIYTSLYRAPKFSYQTECEYSRPDRSVGLLKHMWFGGNIPENPIFYLHPFDIVGGKKAPNLFSHIWYAHPRQAYETLEKLLEKYH